MGFYHEELTFHFQMLDMRLTNVHGPAIRDIPGVTLSGHAFNPDGFLTAHDEIQGSVSGIHGQIFDIGSGNGLEVLRAGVERGERREGDHDEEQERERERDSRRRDAGTIAPVAFGTVSDVGGP